MAVGKSAAGKCGVVHHVEKMQQIVPLITREAAFCQNVCELIRCFDTHYLILRVQLSSVNQPIKRNSVGSRHMSHRGTSSLDDHLYHSFVVFENVQL